jgi:hypothetical protein
LGLIGTAGLLASACSNSPSAGALQGKTATQIVSTSVSAYHRQKSEHFVTKTVAGSQTTVQIGSTSTTTATETLTEGGSPLLNAVLLHNTVYLQAGTQVLEKVLGLSSAAASSHSGKWILVPSGATAYQEVAKSLSPTSAIELFVPEEPHLKVAGLTHFLGHEVLAVAGSPSGVSPGTIATATLFVSTTAPFLPLGATIVFKNAEGKVLQRVASLYGKWNQHVAAVVPAGAVSITTLGS